MAKEVRLSREDLYEKVWTQPTMKVAAEFGISDVALAKICRKMEIPKPPLGYWRRIETGATIAPTPIPEATEKTRRFHYISVSEESDKVSREVQVKIDRESLPENQIKIAEDFLDERMRVEKTKRYYERRALRESDDPFEPFSPPESEGYLDICVSQAQSKRALLILDVFFKAAQARGYETIGATDRWGEQTQMRKPSMDFPLW